jgi:type I restriction enzyme M protein
MAKVKEEKSMETVLWDACNKLRGSVEPSEYKHVILSLIFLKYANDKFTEQREKMIAEGKQSQFLEITSFYTKDNVFFIPENARWEYLMSQAKQDDIAIKIDTALHEIEMKNASLSGALPDNYYSRLQLDAGVLASLLDKMNQINLKNEADKDIFGRIYEYFLSHFAIQEGKGKGEYYTPKTVVALLCELIEPYSGIVYDGACGSGGMFVQSIKFIDEHKGNKKAISVYGQEYTATTRKLALMNLAIRGISANLGEKAASTFTNDLHPDLKADFALMNPPFNQKGWREIGELEHDARWRGYTTPSAKGYANYAWILNMVSKLSQNGVGCLLLANGAMDSDGTDYEIRKQLIENDLVESIIVLPNRMFYSTDISVTVWIFNKNKHAQIVNKGGEELRLRDRSGEVLFLDLRQQGHPYEKKYIEFTPEDRERVVKTYHTWQREGYEPKQLDKKEYCYAAKKEDIVAKDYSLVTSKYIDFDWSDDRNERKKEIEELRRELKDIFEIENRTRKELVDALEEIGYGIS